MGIINYILDRLAIFVGGADSSPNVGNFRSHSILENSIITQNVREQAIRFEKQFDLNRGSVSDFETQFRPKIEAERIAPLNKQISVFDTLISEAIGSMKRVGVLQRSAADILAGKSPRGSGGFGSPHVQRQLQAVYFNRKLKREILTPLQQNRTQLVEFRTQTQGGINDMFKLIAGNSI